MIFFSLSQKKKRQILENTSPDINPKSEIDDIKFEEIFDIEAIQKKLQEDFSEQKNDSEAEPSKLSASELFDIAAQKNAEAALQKASHHPNLKSAKIQKRHAGSVASPRKYVIYVDPENIDFMERLSADEKREIINKILKEQDKVIKDKIQTESRTTFLKHIIFAVITFIIVFPILFTLVNKSLEASINNYQQAKQDFMKLYKTQGKIQMSDQ